MAAGGEALGRYEGLVVFVPFGLPGEIVRVRLVEHKRHFARGAIVDVLKAAPERVTPSCRHFGVCGGCDWQSIDYAAQLRFKTAIVREQLQRIGKLEEVEVRPCVPSPQPYHYRNHARLAVAPNGRLGYRAARSHAVISVEECPILESELTEVLGNAFVQPADSGFTEVVLYAWEEAIDVAGVRYRVSPGVFFQANTAVAELLIDEVLAGLALSGSERVLDLFCGVGLFTVPLAQRAASVVGVEAHPAAAADAQFNLATAGVAGTIVVADVGVALAAADIEQTPWDAVVLDPPRTGIEGAALARLAELAAPTLVYVSCDPATLARDVRYLCEHGYKLTAVQPFDMFPQTHHVETVAWLTR